MLAWAVLLLFSPAANTAETTLDAKGGTLILPGVAQADFVGGSLPVGTRVEMELIPAPIKDEEFNFESGFLGSQPLTEHALTIRITGQQPAIPVTITLLAGKEYPAALFAREDARIFAASENASDYEGPYPVWDNIHVTRPTPNTLRFKARDFYFCRIIDGKQTGIFILSGQRGPL